jgi:hypothetical protein
MNLYDMNDYIQMLGTYVGNKQISVQTLCRSLGLSYEEEQKRLREEAINEAIINKEKAILGNMRLSELLSLDPDKAIPEPAEDVAPAAGEESGEAPPGLPGLSPMGGPPPGGPPPGEPA